MATSSISSSISGLASGLDTTSIVSQLMQVEQQPQQALKDKVTAEQKTVAAYQSVNTKMQAVQTAADTLGLAATWQAAAATSSSTAVTATASAGAPSGEYTFDVTALAKAQVTTAQIPSGTNPAAGASIGISINGAAATNINVTTNTPQGLADAVNAANIGVKAMVVNTDQGTFVQFNASKTGSAGSFTITGLDPATTVTNQTAASDAKITVGDPLHGGYTVSSSTNTFTNLIPNVTLTATAVQAGVTVSVKSDADAIANKMQDLVNAANSALAEIGNQTTYTPGANNKPGVGGPLIGDMGVQTLQQKLLSTVSTGATGYGSYQQLGLQLDKGGKFTFDRAAFIAAYQANPATVQSAVQTGVGSSLSALAKSATDTTTGTLTTAIQGGNDEITSLNDQIDNWGTRLADRQARLQKQFTDMEVALGKLKDQSNWLAGQLGSLPTNSSSNG
jgi:flagellar hook-associated protein 2